MHIIKRIYYSMRAIEKEIKVRYYRQVAEHRFMWSVIKLFSSFKRLQQASAALTYHTVFAIVPVLSLMIAVAKGLGYDEQFKVQLQSFFHGQEEVSDKLLSFAGSYLDNTQVSVWWGVGVGIILLLYSVFSIFQTIDVTFNLLWNQEGRSIGSLMKTFAFVMVIPFVVVIALGLWWSLSSIFNGTVIHEVNVFIFSVAAYTLVLFCVYKLIPKTTVKVEYAALSAVVCGVIFGVMQYFGYMIIAMFNSYRNIYGDLATMIIFLLWIYLSWTICLAGSKWNYFLQRADEQDEENNYNGISFNYYKFITLLVVERIESVYPFSGKFESVELVRNVENVYGIPKHITSEIISSLCARRIIFKGRADKLYLNPKFADRSVGQLLNDLDFAGRNQEVINSSHRIHGNDGLSLLWRCVNGEELMAVDDIAETPVREILNIRAVD